eukprot:2741691-Pleurochrysis_carterae.AAC.3
MGYELTTVKFDLQGSYRQQSRQPAHVGKSQILRGSVRGARSDREAREGGRCNGSAVQVGCARDGNRPRARRQRTAA